MLKSLRDSSLTGPHKVFTAVACIVPLELPVQPGYALEVNLEETEVYFKSDITDQQIIDYVATGEGSDAAGGYKIQETAGKLLIDRIEGDFFNVVGLPVESTIKLIKKTLAAAAADDSDESDSEFDDY
ncbi:hypothetical protein AWJ20_1645 [Sugiyamaella lignohabitans]|uniref:Maf-like protein n=1 Tax=Sugiyamaella lignohabitans TaxID=796027 RepID=A0A167DW03_9ASCO|nr:uncharacterized protein AWJ20_1645 [Sugiyamaella lignohabitans]ANB13358.1 hypothetical protein AWJ20_1645 [Sugiyamaella lignohabitans]